MYSPDVKNMRIAKGIGSVKFLSNAVSEELFSLSQENTYENFMSLLRDIAEKTSLNARQLSNLINIDYFSDYGNARELGKINDCFNFFKQGQAKKIDQKNIPDFLEGCIEKYATNKNAKGKELKQYTITDIDGLLNECEMFVRSLNLPDIPIKIKMQNQREILGYVELTTGKEDDRRNLIILDVFPLKDKNGDVWAHRIESNSLGSGKVSRLTIPESVFMNTPLQENDIIYAEHVYQNKKGYWYLDKYKLIYM